MNQAEALDTALELAGQSGIRHTVRGLRFREGWQYFVYKAGSTGDRSIRTADRRFWEHMRVGSPGVL